MKERQSRLQNLFERIRLYRDWWKVVPPFNRFYNKTREHFVTLRTGEMMQIRDIFGVDLAIIRELFGQDVYNLRELSLPKDAVVLDVGAHIGSFSAAIHSKFADARITAFEPHPDNFIFLQKNAPFAECVNVAVAGHEGEAYLGDHRASSSYALGDSGLAVKTVTLESYMCAVPRIDLLKVDVEGSEKDIFENLNPSLLMRVDRIFMEIHPPHKNEWFVSLLENAGFQVSLEDNILFATRENIQ